MACGGRWPPVAAAQRATDDENYWNELKKNPSAVLARDAYWKLTDAEEKHIKQHIAKAERRRSETGVLSLADD